LLVLSAVVVASCSAVIRLSLPTVVFLPDDARRAGVDAATLLDFVDAFLDAFAPALDALALVDGLSLLLNLVVETDNLLLGL
jgi:hypothetical protein